MCLFSVRMCVWEGGGVGHTECAGGTEICTEKVDGKWYLCYPSVKDRVERECAAERESTPGFDLLGLAVQ